jgi:2-polyprenyl-6-methoxyphenol hydroxylase-like FAD-dependent oxidoreductase
MDTINTDVIIIGGGPTGLSLACQFIRYGIDFVIVEKNESFTRFSKAIGVQARTLEIYEQLGLAQPAIEEGEIASKIRLIEGGEVRGEMHLSNFGKDLSAYPYMLMLEQSKNEELLYRYLERHGREVWWNTELESFSQDENGVTARVSKETRASCKRSPASISSVVMVRAVLSGTASDSRSKAARSSVCFTLPMRALIGSCRTTRCTFAWRARCSPRSFR